MIPGSSWFLFSEFLVLESPWEKESPKGQPSENPEKFKWLELETNSSPLKMVGWKMTFLVGNPICRCYVGFREGIYSIHSLGELLMYPKIGEQLATIGDSFDP